MKTDCADCLIVGAGPAGLTAAIYLARFRLHAVVTENAQSRASLIPLSRNQAGFPKGITGPDLLGRLWEQAALYGVRPQQGTVSRLERIDSGFKAFTNVGSLHARTVLLATGVADHRPQMDRREHDAAVGRGVIRYCPVCDGYEVAGRRVGVLGTGEHGAREAEFLRSFTSDVSLISHSAPHDMSDQARRRLLSLDICLVDGPIGAVIPKHDRVILQRAVGDLSYDILYPAIGSTANSGLAAAVGSRITDEGCLIVDAHQRTNVKGLYGAGDVVAGLNQISHAMGSAGVAATAIRNELAARAPLLYAG